jgi:hypothetical protein
MKYLALTLVVLASLATAIPAKADCRWEWNGNSMQQICR